eukprot:2898086-Pleurochrysis_carterae.AAC.1
MQRSTAARAAATVKRRARATAQAMPADAAARMCAHRATHAHAGRTGTAATPPCKQRNACQTKLVGLVA